MSKISNITAKDASGKTVTFTALNGQSGSDPAAFASMVGVNRAQWPTLTISVRRTQNQASKIQLNFTSPVLDKDGLQIAKVPVKIELTAPDVTSVTQIADVQAVLSSIANDQLFVETFKTVTPII